MNAARGLWFALLFVALVVLHYTLRPVLDWRASIDFLAIAVLLVAVRARPGVAALVGFAVGITSDALTPGAFGAGALAFSLIAFTASKLKAAFFADNLLLNAIFVFLGKWLGDLIYLAAERRLGAPGVFLAARPVMGAPRG